MNLKDIWNYIINQLSAVSIIDIIDILIVAVIFYYTFKFIRDRRAGKVAAGIFLLLLALALSGIIGTTTLNFILKNIFQVGLIALIIVFQPELRSALEKIGTGSLKGLNRKLDTVASTDRKYIAELCNAAEDLSRDKTGALIILERSTKLGDVIKTGTIVDAVVSSFLLCNIFYDKAPLHDGAVVIRQGRIFCRRLFFAFVN